MMVKNHNHLGVALAAAAAGILAAVGMLMLMLVVVEPAGAAFPGQNGKIAFVSYVGTGNSEIFTVNADGTELERLTNNTVKDHYPAWSPGRNTPITGDNLIAFSSERPDGGDGDIYTINPLGIKVGPLTLYPTVRLTNDPAQDIFPAWSPDGNKIAFASNRAGFHGATGDCMLGHPCNYDIYTMNADGTELDPLTDNPRSDYKPAWSPDGKTIAFTSFRDGNQEIYTMNANGTNQTNVTNDTAEDGVAAWSPDGNKIAFSSKRDGDDDIYTMNADGSDVHNVSNNTDRDTEPAWSPDGNKIAFSSNRGGSYEIYTMNANGTEVKRILDDPGHLPDWQPLQLDPGVCVPPFCN
jgi:Tol biopolymer transport system component